MFLLPFRLYSDIDASQQLEHQAALCQRIHSVERRNPPCRRQQHLSVLLIESKNIMFTRTVCTIETPPSGNPSISGAWTSKVHSAGPKEHSIHPQQNIYLEMYHGKAESLVEHHITLLVILLRFLVYLYKCNFMPSNSDSINVHTSSSSNTWIVPQ